jgi:hypothetical protein
MHLLVAQGLAILVRRGQQVGKDVVTGDGLLSAALDQGVQGIIQFAERSAQRRPARVDQPGRNQLHQDQRILTAAQRQDTMDAVLEVV